MYFLLENQDPEHPCRWMNDWPFVEDMDFDLGRKLTVPVPDPIQYTLYPVDHANDHGPEMPAVFKIPIPLFRDDFIQAMRDFGVNNLDCYNAAIYDPDNGETYTNYKAVNIIGLIAAADMTRSKATVHPGGPIIDVDFDGLYIDEEKAGGEYIFRLAESTNAILVHENLKNYLVEKGFDHVCFGDPRTSAV